MTTFASERTNVGEGWQPLIAGLNQNLINLIGQYELTEITQRFGVLRYYLKLDADLDRELRDQVWSMVDEVQMYSAHLCEWCGEPGRTRTLPEMVTLCDRHYEERQHGMNAPAPTHRDDASTKHETLLAALEQILTTGIGDDHVRLSKIHALVAEERAATDED